MSKLQVSFGICFGFFSGLCKIRFPLDLESRQLKAFRNRGKTYVSHFSWLEVVTAGVGNISTAQYNFPDNADGSSFNSYCLSKEIVQWTEMKYRCSQHQNFTISILKEKEFTNFTCFRIDRESQMQLLCKF